MPLNLDNPVALRELIRHCWVHSGYADCGYLEMDTSMKQLYCDVIGCDKAERDMAHERKP